MAAAAVRDQGQQACPYQAKVAPRGCFCKEWLQKFSVFGLLNGWLEKQQ